MQIWFSVKGFPINVSSHGYFIIFSRKVPPLKFSTCPSVVYEGFADELEGIRYIPENDNLNVDLSDPELEKAVKKFVDEHLEELEKRDKILIKKWNEIIKNKEPLEVNGKKIKIGDYAEYEGEIIKILWYDKETDELFFESLKSKSIWGTSLANLERMKKLSKKEAIVNLL